jgi:hypothetical protein
MHAKHKDVVSGLAREQMHSDERAALQIKGCLVGGY